MYYGRLMKLGELKVEKLITSSVCSNHIAIRSVFRSLQLKERKKKKVTE